MACEAEDPPTSIISPAECDLSQVIFKNVQQFYKPNTDIQCTFCRDESFASRSEDWIGIFKVGWKTTREYCSWISAQTNVDNTVLFKARFLPKDDDYYQFCYVDYKGEARGASIPFQFSYNIPEDNDILVEEGHVTHQTYWEFHKKNSGVLGVKMEMRTDKEKVKLKKIVKILTKENTQLQEKVSSLQNETQAQADRIQNLQDELLSSTTKMQRLETENRAENENKIKQMGGLHMTIANLEGEVRRLKDECKRKMEAERTVRQLKTHLQSAEDTKQDLEMQLAQQKDICRQQGEEMLKLRSALQLIEEDLKDYGSSTSRRPQSPLQCPICSEKFLPHQQQIYEDHVVCHVD